MITIIDILTLLIPIIIAIAFYYLLNYIFVVLYIKSIKKAIDEGKIEKAEKRKKIALRKNPKKAEMLFYKYNIIEKKDVLSDYEIEDPNELDSTSISLEFLLNKRDLFRYINWKIPIAIRALILVPSIIIIFLASSIVTLIVLLILIVTLTIYIWFNINKNYENNLFYNVKIVFNKDKIIYFVKGKVYEIDKELIKDICITKKDIFIVLKIDKVTIIPKRFIEEKDQRRLMEYIEDLKPNLQ